MDHNVTHTRPFNISKITNTICEESFKSVKYLEHYQPGKRVYLERDLTSVRATPAELAVVTITEGPNVVVISNTQSLSIAAP